MQYRIANFLSSIFHPIFYFFYVFVYLLFFTDIFLPFVHTYKIWIILSYLFLNSIVIPVILIYFFQKDFKMEDRKKRTIPYLIIIAVYILIFLFFKKFLLPQIIIKYLIAIISGMLILTIINYFKKLSLHTTALGAVLALFIILFFNEPNTYFSNLIFITIIAGAVSSSRLFLKTHTNFEIFGGFVLGISVMLLQMLF